MNYRIIACCIILSAVIFAGCATQSTDTEQKPDNVGEKTQTSNDISETPPKETSVIAQSGSEIPTVQADTRNDTQAESVDSSPDVQNQAQPGIDSIEEYNQLSGQVVGGKKLSIPKITGSVNPRNDEYHDNQNNAIVVLQDPTFAMKDFPRDRRMEVDWVKTLDQGFIEPRADLLGSTKMKTLNKDILMKNTQFMPWVKFPHLQHTRWLACENCHPRIFIPKEDANPISMNKVLRGEYCGVCHDKVAFALFVCERCHSVPHEGSGPKWW